MALLEEGYTQRVTAARVGCTQASVSEILKKMVYGNVKDAKNPPKIFLVVRKSKEKEGTQRLWDAIRHAINHHYFTMAVCLFLLGLSYMEFDPLHKAYHDQFFLTASVFQHCI